MPRGHGLSIFEVFAVTPRIPESMTSSRSIRGLRVRRAPSVSARRFDPSRPIAKRSGPSSPSCVEKRTGSPSRVQHGPPPDPRICRSSPSGVQMKSVPSSLQATQSRSGGTVPVSAAGVPRSFPARCPSPAPCEPRDRRIDAGPVGCTGHLSVRVPTQEGWESARFCSRERPTAACSPPRRPAPTSRSHPRNPSTSWRSERREGR